MPTTNFDLSILRRTLLKNPFGMSEKYGLRPSFLSSERSAFTPDVDSILNGPRRKRYPLIALTTQRSMGPARHTLSQRVVAGTFFINPPYKP